MDDDDDEDEEIVGSLLSSLENILLRGTNVSHDKMRNQSEKDHLLSRHTSLYPPPSSPSTSTVAVAINIFICY
jgi:hypothetical protein